MNWGKWIVLVLAVFVLGIAAMSLRFFLSPNDDYDHQYYEKGLSFNHDYDREVQVNKDHAEPKVAIENSDIKFAFALPAIGRIKFMRPSDTALDKTFAINSGEGHEVSFPRKNFPAGAWQIEMEWVSNQKAYLYHKEVYIK